MGTQLEGLLKEIEAFGAANDASITDRPRRMLNITRDTGEFLSVLVRVMSARRIPEIGTSNGYSTLWLADAARSVGGTVTTVELSALKVAMAKDSFARSGIASSIHQLHQDAGDVLAKSDDSAFDFIFLDSERSEYAGWWPDIKRTLRPGGLLVVDNAISHAKELAPFMSPVRSDEGCVTSLVPVGNGEFLAARER